MSTAGNKPERPQGTIGKLPLESPPPHPLLWPALGLILGIWLSEQVGSAVGSGRVFVFVAPLVLLVVLLAKDIGLQT